MLYLDDLSAQFARVATLADERRVPITSVVTLPTEPTSTSRAVILRIATIQAKPFIDALHQAGIRTDLEG